MKGLKKNLAQVLSLFLVAMMTLSFSVWGEEETETASWAESEQLTASEASSLVQAVSSHLSAYGRYEGINGRSLYQAAVDRLMEENPDVYHTVLKAMLESVDEYSEYYTVEETRELEKTLTGEITTGIGVTLDFTDGSQAVIASVIPGMPAERAGLQVGDILVRANGTELRGVNSETILSLVRGEAGTTVCLEIERDGKVLNFEMIREPLIGTSVTSEIYEEDDRKVLYIKLYGFIENTASAFRDALKEAKQEGISHFILDLRDNGGGMLDQAIEVADCFVPKGKIITTEDHKNPIFNQIFYGTEGEKTTGEIVVLVNEYSASASEVLAAALAAERACHSGGNPYLRQRNHSGIKSFANRRNDQVHDGVLFASFRREHQRNRAGAGCVYRKHLPETGSGAV